MTDKEYRVEVHWLDSGLQIHGWTKIDTIRETVLSTVETVGYLVHEDDSAYFVALSRDKENSNYYGVQVIDKASVRKMKRLRWQSK